MLEIMANEGAAYAEMFEGKAYDRTSKDELMHFLKLADINDVRENSSWFKGYTEKYFVNMGTIYSAMSPRFSTLWIIQYIIRHRDTTKDLGFFNCLKLMFKGKSKKID